MTVVMTVLALVSIVFANLFTIQNTQAAGGDFSLDFAAAAPFSYNHLTGGGAFDDGTNGKDADVVESLEGGDFACGNIVTFFTLVTVADTTQAQTDAPQTIELDFSFLADTTGQSGVALGDIVYVGVNRGSIQDLIPGEDTTDSGNIEDGGSMATLISESLTGPLFADGSKLLGTVQLTDLERAEQVVVRVDVKLYCDPDSSPTGNLQGDLAAARLTVIQGNVAVTPPEAISAGAQTIPFKQAGDIAFPAIEVIKTVTTNSGTCPGIDLLEVNLGDTVKYCYEVSNPSDVTDAPGATLYNITLSDDHGTPGDAADDFLVPLTGLTDEDNDGVADDLAAGGSATGFVLITMPSVGTVVNTVTATGYDAIILPTVYTDTDAATVKVTFTALPLIDIEKYVSVDNGTTWLDADSAPGPPLNEGVAPMFKFMVTNTGNVALSGITLADSVFNLSGCIVPQSLPVSGSFECVLPASWQVGQHTNTATATGSYEEMTATDSDDANYFGIAAPELVVDKKADPVSLPEPGGAFTFTVVVENLSASPVTLVSLVDDIYGDLSDLTAEGGAAKLQSSTTCAVPQLLAANNGQSGGADEYSCTFSAAVVGNAGYSEIDTVTATAVNEAGSDTAFDSAEVFLTDVLPAVVVEKVANPTVVPETGGDVVFTFTVTNGSIEAAAITVLTDSQFGDLEGDDDCKVGTILPTGASCEFSMTRTISGVFGGPDHTNIFTATVMDDEQNPASDSDDATVTFTDVTFALALNKSVEQTSYSQPGEVLTYLLVAQNIGNGTLTNVTISDPLLGALVCQPEQPATLQPDEKLVCTGSYTVQQGDIDAGQVMNTATATSSETEPTQDSEVVPALQQPGLTLVKSGDAGPVTLGDMVHYTLVVKNTGNVTLHDVVVTDSKLGIHQTVDVLAVGQEVVITGSYGPVLESDLPGPIFNTAIATGKTPDDKPVGPVDDSHEVPLTSTPALTLVKTALPITYSKIGDTISYQYKLTNAGNVTLYAPFTVSDDKATVACSPLPVSIAPAESILCTATYVISETDLVAGAVTNVAQAKAYDPQQKEVFSNKDEETVTYVPLPASLGDWVWLDTNKNGLQDPGEEGVAGVKVDLYTENGLLVATTSTDAGGGYLFTGLKAGAYYVEFTTPQGYRFTQYDVNNNSQDAVDNDARVPKLDVTISDGGVEPELGAPLTYTFYYTNTDTGLAATQVVISAVVPEGTSYLGAGWNCTSGNAGGICTLILPPIAPKATGSVTFVILLKANDNEVPDRLDLIVTVTQVAIGRTGLVSLTAGEEDRTVDAGLISIEVQSLHTPTPTEPTGLPKIEQPVLPTEKITIFLPALRLDTEAVESNSIQRAAEQAGQEHRLFLPTVDARR